MLVDARLLEVAHDDLALAQLSRKCSCVVLRVARGGDMVANLADAFAGVVREIGVPAVVLGCDCVLRYLEIEQAQLRPAIDALLTRHNVVGFATYGEQYNAMHVNQTFTGVAIARNRPPVGR